MAKYKFDEGKYKNTFDVMFGQGSFQNGIDQAALLGRTSAEAKFAEQMYMERLRAAEAAARASRRGRGGRGGRGGDDGVVAKTNTLVDEFRNAKQLANQNNLDYYNQKMSAKLNEGRSKARLPVEQIFGGLPTMVSDKRLTPWDVMKQFGG